jgi:histidinol-phosphate aminotransferase
VSLEFTQRALSIPFYPAAATYEFHGELVKLASNETPWAPHAAVLEAVEAALHNLNRYPDPTGSALRHRIADRTGHPVSGIALGNGSCDILLAAAEAMLEPGAEIVYAWPSFSMYPHLSAMTGARAVTVPLDDEGRHDLEAMAREITAATRIVIVCNPNNPTATALPIEEIDQFVAGVPRHVAVIVDEAYVEFSLMQDPDESLPLLRKHPNLVLLRTFSKVFRIGVERVRQPFYCNMLAQAAAAEAILHQDEVARRVERTAIERVFVQDELTERGLDVTESQANFSWVSLGDRDEAEVMAGLNERGVIVRAGTALGEEGRLRVTYGTRHENERFLAALDEVFAAL